MNLFPARRLISLGASGLLILMLLFSLANALKQNTAVVMETQRPVMEILKNEKNEEMPLWTKELEKDFGHPLVVEVREKTWVIIWPKETSFKAFTAERQEVISRLCKKNWIQACKDK